MCNLGKVKGQNINPYRHNGCVKGMLKIAKPLFTLRVDKCSKNGWSNLKSELYRPPP